jgi:hypothetical protein
MPEVGSKISRVPPAACHIPTCAKMAKVNYVWLAACPSRSVMPEVGHDRLWPFYDMLACGSQLEALWVLSEPTLGMTDMLGHAAGQT